MNPVWSRRVVMPGSPIATSMAILTWALHRAWNTTGAPLFLAVVVAVWTALISDAVWAFLAVRRPKLRIETPSSCLVGEPYRVALVEAKPKGAVLKLNEAHGSGTVRLGAVTNLEAKLDYRGLLSAHFGEITVYGPLGLVACRRRFSLANDHPQFVGPLPDLQATLPQIGSDDESEQSAYHSRGDELTKSIRQYRRGDSRQHIAWKASARRGELLVREFEGLVDNEVTIVAEIRKHDDESSELAMGRAAGYSVNALRAGLVVRLLTNHCDPPFAAAVARPPAFGKVVLERAAADARPLLGVVRSEFDVLQRLAAAVPSKDLMRYVDRDAFYVGSDGDRWVQR